MATKKKSNARAWEIGGAVTAAAIAAAAGAYLLTDKKTKAKAKAWVVKARKEVARQAKTAKKLGKAEYGHLVDHAVKQYGKMEDMTAAEMLSAAKNMKAEWDHIQAEAKKMAKVKTVKKHPAKKKSAHKKAAPKKRA